MTADVIVARDDKILRVTMNRPAKKNALTGAMYDAMREALELADRDDNIRAVLLTGTDGVFTAGNDIGDFLAGTRDEHGSPALRFIHTIALCDTPIIAAVEGNAVGVGTTMLFHCDLVYAAPSAKFRMPFIDLGLVPEAASSMTVPLRVGMATPSTRTRRIAAASSTESSRQASSSRRRLTRRSASPPNRRTRLPRPAA